MLKKIKYCENEFLFSYENRKNAHKERPFVTFPLSREDSKSIFIFQPNYLFTLLNIIVYIKLMVFYFPKKIEKKLFVTVFSFKGGFKK